MKPILSCLTLLLIGFPSSHLSAQLFNQYPPLSKEELRKNKIKSISEQSFSTCDVFDYKHLTTASASYDARGNMTSSYRYGQWTGEPQISSYKYDDQDNIIEETTDYRTTRFEHHYAVNYRGKVLEDTYPGGKHTFRYNATGNVVESAYFRRDGSLDQKTTHTYDDKGDVGETLNYDSAGHVSRTVATYDVAGHRTKEEKFDSDGQLSSRTVDTYDRAGQITKEEHYGPGGKSLTYWTTFKHDPKGLVIESDDFHPTGECSSVTKGRYELYP
jgi:YD repeat-containing protein